MHPKPFNDLKFSRGLAILVQHRTGGGSHVRWKAHFLSSYGASSAPCFSQMRRQVQWQLQGEGFTCLDQYLCMAFAQLTYRESPRDIESPEEQAVPYGNTHCRFTQHLGQCQQGKRLAKFMLTLLNR